MARKRRADSAKAKALDKDLKAMFRTLEEQPTPQRLRKTVEELDIGQEPKKER